MHARLARRHGDDAIADLEIAQIEAGADRRLPCGLDRVHRGSAGRRLVGGRGLDTREQQAGEKGDVALWHQVPSPGVKSSDAELMQ